MDLNWAGVAVTQELAYPRLILARPRNPGFEASLENQPTRWQLGQVSLRWELGPSRRHGEVEPTGLTRW